MNVWLVICKEHAALVHSIWATFDLANAKAAQLSVRFPDTLWTVTQRKVREVLDGVEEE